MNVPRCYESLREFIAWLDDQNEIRRITAQVDPDQEIAEITDRVSKAEGGGPGLKFENIADNAWPVVTNLLGSSQRSAWALGAEQLSDLTRRLESALVATDGKNAAMRLARLIAEKHFQPLDVSCPACQEVIHRDAIDLSVLPFLQNYNGDGGRYLTLPLVFTSAVSGDQKNCGIYRVQLVGPDRLAIHWRDSSDSARHYREHCDAGKNMPVAIALGGDPALLFSAAMRLPPNVDELAFSGYLRDAPVRTTRCLTNNLAVPATAEMVIEGELEPDDFYPEGPFGNHTGYYQPERQCPVIKIRTITHRRDPIIPATVVGQPPTENCYLGKGLERLLLPLLKIDHPEIKELCMPFEGIFHGCAFLAAEIFDADRTRKLIQEIASGPWLRGSRMLVLFDQKVNIHDSSVCFWRAINQVEFSRDVEMVGTTLTIDATRDPVGSETCSRSEDVVQKVSRRWEEYGLDRIWKE